MWCHVTIRAGVVNCWVESVFNRSSARHSNQILTVLGKSEPSLEAQFLTSQFLLLWCSELCCAHSPQPSVPRKCCLLMEVVIAGHAVTDSVFYSGDT